MEYNFDPRSLTKEEMDAMWNPDFNWIEYHKQYCKQAIDPKQYVNMLLIIDGRRKGII